MTNAIEARAVSLAFGPVRVLDGVSFTVPDGAFVAMVGPNGSGKTTLLQIILGLRPPDLGEIKLQGAAPQDFPPDRIGYVPQLKTLDRSFPARAIELVVTGLRRQWPWRINARERFLALEAMQRTGVSYAAQRDIAALSGGELQRVYLARALVRRPRLILLDEPAGGMDLAGEADMYHLLAEYQEEHGATILMITHDWEGARLHASHVLLVHQGKVVFGAPDEVADEGRLLQVFGHSGHYRATHLDTADA